MAQDPPQAPKSPSSGSSSSSDHVRREASSGHRARLGHHELEGANKRILASFARFEKSHFIIPAEQPIQLVFLRFMFKELRKQTQTQAPFPFEEEVVPVEAFERVFQRLFFLLGDARGFDIKEYDDNQDEFMSWSEFFRVYRERAITVRLSVCERIFYTMEDPDSSICANLVSIFVLVVIAISSFSFVLSTMSTFQVQDSPEQAPQPAPVLTHIDTVCLVIFVVEYLLRLLTCWNVRLELARKNQTRLLDMVVGYQPIFLPSPFTRVLRFMLTPTNVVDFAAIFPCVLGMITDVEGSGYIVLRLIRLTRLFRVFKSRSFIEPVIIIWRTLQVSTSALYILVFNLGLGVIISGSLIYIVEGMGRWDEATQSYKRYVGRQWNETAGKFEELLDATPFISIPDSFWWSLVTIMTVGYGDHYPTTDLGKVVAAATMIFSLVMLALPVGVMGGNFSQVWSNFDNEKIREERMLKEAQLFVTTQMLRLAPERLSKMMLIEIWDDNCMLTGPEDARPSAHSFMGEAKCSLYLPVNQVVEKQVTLQLESNEDIVDRNVTGDIVMRYQWTPAGLQTSKYRHVGFADDTPMSESEFKGTLQITIVSADRLINLRGLGTSRRNVSSPYCLVFVYPNRPSADGVLHPSVWRTLTAPKTLSPVWEATDTFDYNWTYSRGPPRSPRKEGKNAIVSKFAAGESDELTDEPCDLDSALAILTSLRGDLQMVKATISPLVARVNRLVEEAERQATRLDTLF